MPTLKPRHYCPFCFRHYARKMHLNSHLKSHGPGNVAKCKVCSKLFADPKNLKRHMETHKKKRDYFECIVEGCSYKYLTKQGLNAHIAKWHLANSQKSMATGGRSSPLNMIRPGTSIIPGQGGNLNRGGIDERGNVPHKHMTELLTAHSGNGQLSDQISCVDTPEYDPVHKNAPREHYSVRGQDIHRMPGLEPLRSTTSVGAQNKVTPPNSRSSSIVRIALNTMDDHLDGHNRAELQTSVQVPSPALIANEAATTVKEALPLNRAAPAPHHASSAVGQLTVNQQGSDSSSQNNGSAIDNITVDASGDNAAAATKRKCPFCDQECMGVKAMIDHLHFHSGDPPESVAPAGDQGMGFHSNSNVPAQAPGSLPREGEEDARSQGSRASSESAFPACSLSSAQSNEGVISDAPLSSSSFGDQQPRNGPTPRKENQSKPSRIRNKRKARQAASNSIAYPAQGTMWAILMAPPPWASSAALPPGLPSPLQTPFGVFPGLLPPSMLPASIAVKQEPPSPPVVDLSSDDE